MAATFQHADAVTGNVATAVTGWTVTLPASLATDGIVGIFLAFDSVNAPVPTVPTGWTAATGSPLTDTGTTPDVKGSLWFRRVTDAATESGSSVSVTFNAAAAGTWLTFEVEGASTAELSHAEASHATSTGTSHSTGALTTTVADCLVVAMTAADFSTGQAPPYTWSAPLTERIDVVGGLAVAIGAAEAVEASAVTAKTYSFSQPTSDANVGWVIAWQAASGGGPPAVPAFDPAAFDAGAFDATVAKSYTATQGATASVVVVLNRARDYTATQTATATATAGGTPSTATKTFPFVTDAEGFVGTAGALATLTWDSTAGNPAGALRSRAEGKAAAAANLWEYAGTWESLGVPVDSTVTAIRLNSGSTQCSEYAKASSSTIGPYELRDSVDTLLGTLWSGRTVTAVDAAFVEAGAQSDVAVPSAQQPSATSIKVQLRDTLNTTTAGGGATTFFIGVHHDQVEIVITYTAGGGGVTTTKAYTATQTATASASNTVDRVRDYTATQSAIAASSRVVARVRTVTASQAATATASRAASGVITKAYTATQGAGATVSRSLARVRGGTATQGAGASVVRVVARVRSQTATQAALATASRASAGVTTKSVTATQTAAAIVSKSVSRVRTQTATATATATVSRSLGKIRAATATATGVATSTRLRAFGRAATATVTATASVSRVRAWGRAVTATATAATVASRAGAYTRAVSATATAIGMVSRQLLGQIAAYRRVVMRSRGTSDGLSGSAARDTLKATRTRED
ncbi:MAG: hypothetical protein M3506_00435 [Chloroflexota bacterium]|nr:hypothetical protein [Chloroflexota bacterium]